MKKLKALPIYFWLLATIFVFGVNEAIPRFNPIIPYALSISLGAFCVITQHILYINKKGIFLILFSAFIFWYFLTGAEVDTDYTFSLIFLIFPIKYVLEKKSLKSRLASLPRKVKLKKRWLVLGGLLLIIAAFSISYIVSTNIRIAAYSEHMEALNNYHSTMSGLEEKVYSSLDNGSNMRKKSAKESISDKEEEFWIDQMQLPIAFYDDVSKIIPPQQMEKTHYKTLEGGKLLREAAQKNIELIKKRGSVTTEEVEPVVDAGNEALDMINKAAKERYQIATNAYKAYIKAYKERYKIE